MTVSPAVLTDWCIAKGTVSSQKHEILFSRFGINYNALPSRFRKGSVLVREKVLDGEADTPEVTPKGRQASTRITLLHSDIIGDEFWEQRPYLLAEI